MFGNREAGATCYHRLFSSTGLVFARQKVQNSIIPALSSLLRKKIVEMFSCRSALISIDFVVFGFANGFYSSIGL